MGGWNRSRHVRGHRDRRPSRPPLPPPDYGHEHCSVPLWEREFCCYAANISWQRFCETKEYLGVCVDLDHWDDSGALESFQNAKARFWAHYHGQPSDIPLPDPDMYIDKVDHGCKVDPGLVADLDKVGLPFDSDNNNSAATTEAGKKPSQNQSGNWDVYIEKPAETSKWESELPTSDPDATWGVRHEPSNDWGNSNSGWGDTPANPSWQGSSSNYHSSYNRNDFRGGFNNRYQDRSNMPGRKRGSGGHFQHRNSSRQRNQAEGDQRIGWQDHREGYQRGGWQDHRGYQRIGWQDHREGYYRRSSGWQDHRGRRNREWRPVHNRNCQSGQGPDSGF